MAYPKKDIPLSSLKAARHAFATLKARAVQSPGRRSLRWDHVGPDTALYQFTPFRTARSYVPQEYAAAGRTTDLAIDPNCGSHQAWGGRHGGRCRDVDHTGRRRSLAH